MGMPSNPDQHYGHGQRLVMKKKLEARLETKLGLGQSLRFRTQVRQVSGALGVEPKELLEMLVHRNYRIMLVEPDDSMRQNLISALNRDNCTVRACEGPGDAEGYMRSSRLWDAAILSFEQMSGAPDGVGLARKLRAIDPEIPIIVYTSESAMDLGNRTAKTYSALVRDSFVDPSRSFVPSWVNAHGDVIYSLQNDKGVGIGVEIRKRDNLQNMNVASTVSGVRTDNLFDDEQRSLAADRQAFATGNLMQMLYGQFFNVQLERRIPILVKMGGSHFDLVEDKIDQDAIKYFADYLTGFARANPQFAVIVFPGGGHLNDNIKDWLANPVLGYKPGDRLIENMARNILDVQAQKLLTAFGENNAYIVDPNNSLAFGAITDDSFRERPIMIWPYAPRELRRMYGLSMAFSDAQTLSTGALFHAQRTLFTKNTAGIYTWDPNRKDFDEHSGQKILEVSCSDMRRGRVRAKGQVYDLSRLGTDDRGQHLCEDAGLDVMQQLRIPKRVVVAHPRTPNVLERVFLSNELIRVGDYHNSLSSIVLRYDQRDGFPPKR